MLFLFHSWAGDLNQPEDPDHRIKGTMSRDGYFFEGLNILISTFCASADDFQGLSEALHYPIQLLTFYLLL